MEQDASKPFLRKWRQYSNKEVWFLMSRGDCKIWGADLASQHGTASLLAAALLFY